MKTDAPPPPPSMGATHDAPATTSTDETMWSAYAAAAIAAGHRTALAIGEIADEAVRAHRERFAATLPAPPSDESKKPPMTKGRDEK